MMMKQTFYILLFFLFTGCSNSQTSVTLKKLTGNISVDLKSFLQNGKVTADIMDGIKPNPRREELEMKFEIAIKNNYDWFLEYSKSIPEGEPMPYHKNIGLTKEEYAELLNYYNNTEILSSGTEDIIIQLKNDTIHFNSQRKLANINSLIIDLKNNVALFKGYRLTFYDTVTIVDDKNGLKSKSKGYRWAFYEPKDLDINDMKDLENLNKKDYTLTIRRLEKNNKTFLHFEAREVTDGLKTVAIDLPIMF